MNLEELSNKNRVRKITPNRKTSLKSIEIAKRDLKTSKDLYDNKDYDWALITSYNAMLQATRSYMYHKGYVPKGPHKHLSTVQFLRCFEKTFGKSTIRTLDKVRKRRHRTVYDEPKTVSESEAKRTLSQAEKLVKKIEKSI